MITNYVQSSLLFFNARDPFKLEDLLVGWVGGWVGRRDSEIGASISN